MNEIGTMINDQWNSKQGTMDIEQWTLLYEEWTMINK